MNERSIFTEPQLAAACETLTEFVWERADATRTRTGVDWVFTPDAPNTYQELRQAWEVSLSTGAALPVLNDHSESVIFNSPEGNLVYRYWHDVTHLERGRTSPTRTSWTWRCSTSGTPSSTA